jgi:hypothetical protein
MTDFEDAAGNLERLASKIGPIAGRDYLVMPQIKSAPNVLVENTEANYASEFHKRIAKLILDFDAELDQAHDVGVRLVSFGQTLVFHLEDMGYWNPSLITFAGRLEDGSPVKLVQHVTQISVLLMKLPRKEPSKPKSPFGFTKKQVQESKETQ